MHRLASRIVFPALLGLVLAASGCAHSNLGGAPKKGSGGMHSSAPVSQPLAACTAEQMNCCGTCVAKSEGKCPDNIQCPVQSSAPTK